MLPIGVQTSQLASQLGEASRLRPFSQVAAQRRVGHVLAHEMPEPEGVDNAALTVTNPEPITTFLAHLDAAEVERRGTEDMDPGWRVIDRWPTDRPRPPFCS